MSDVMIIAKFNPTTFFSMSEADLQQVRAQAIELFGGSPEDPDPIPPTNEVNWLYSGTPTSGDGGWVAIVTGSSYHKFSGFLRGPLSKIYEFEIRHLNRTDPQGDGDTSAVDTMIPVESHSW